MELNAERDTDGAQSHTIQKLPREGRRHEDLRVEDMNFGILKGAWDIYPRLWLALDMLPP